jgi:hypothetical protein
MHVSKTCEMLNAIFALVTTEAALFIQSVLLVKFIDGKDRDIVVKKAVISRRSHSSGRGHSSLYYQNNSRLNTCHILSSIRRT